MKRNKILKVVLVAAFAMVAGYTAYSSQQVETMSDIALENVEALAQGENDQYSQNIWKVYKTSTGHSCTKGGSKKCL